MNYQPSQQAQPPPRESEVRIDDGFEDFLENAAIGLHWVDGNGIITWANRADYEMVGYSAEEYIGQSIAKFHTDAALLANILERLRAGQTLRNVEAKLRAKDGSTRDVLITSSARFDEQGSFLYTRCFTQDVTDQRRKTANALDLARHSHEQLRMIADALPALIGYIGSDLRYRFANSTYEQWFGEPPESVVGKTMPELLGPAAFEAIRGHVERALGGEAATFEGELAYRLGARSVRASYTPHRDAHGAVDGVVVLVHDTTREQKAAREREELLRIEQSARERLSALSKASEVLAQSLDYEHVLAQVPALAVPAIADFAVLDLKEGELVRRSAYALDDELRELFLVATHFQQAEGRELNVSALLSGRSGHHPEIDDAWLRKVARSENELTLLRRAAPRSMITVPLAYDGDTLGALTLFFGPSGRKHDLNDLALAEEIARRAAAALVNARLFKEARDAIGLRDDFLSMAGHELRTPLTALQLQIFSISKMAGQPGGSEKVADRAEKAGRNVLRLSNLVNELLDISRISSGRLRLECAPFELGDAVREVVTRHSEELSKNGCELTLEAADGLRGYWDRLRVEQIVTNLLANAIQYGKGKPIEVSVERVDAFARIVVRDHGIGIPQADQERIFQRFERAVSSRHFGGLGFGLWIARQLVDAHGGDIRVQSESDRGATFEVELPLSSHDGLRA